MTIDEAVALLREAHSVVDPTDTDLFDRISDALTAHDTEADQVSAARRAAKNLGDGRRA